MKLHGICLFAVVVAALAPVLSAQQPGLSDLPASIRIQSLGMEDVKPDRLEMVARLGIYPERSFRARQIGFFDMRVDQIPVYVASLTGDFQLKKGELLTLPDLHITVYYRDVPSLDRVRGMIQNQRAAVTGQITADLEATTMEKIALRSLHPRIVAPFGGSIDVSIPGGPLGTAAALAVLKVASSVAPTASSVFNSFAPGKDAPWRKRLANDEARHVVVVRTHALLVAAEGNFPLDYLQLGFWIAPGTVLIPAEAVRPWEFDPEASARIAAGAYVDKKSVEMTVAPLVADSAPQTSLWSLAAKEFRVAFDGSPARNALLASPQGSGAQIRQRASASNYALLRFRVGILGNPVQTADPEAQNWTRLGVLRLLRSAADSAPKPDVVLVPGNLEGRQIQLAEPVDDSAFGSPLFTEQGVVGMVVDEHTALLINNLKSVDLKPIDLKPIDPKHIAQ